jgi:NADPH:quinone reductase
MRRVRYYEYGEPDVLRLEEVDPPTPAEGQVRLAAEAIGVGYIDAVMRRGSSPLGGRPLPGRPFGDVVGTVEAVGPGVDAVLIGDRVAALVESDAYADQVVTGADWLAPVPAGLDLGSASILAMPAPVALRVLRTGQLAAGETVLVHAAAGGIGHLVTQLAKIEGAGTVIATVSSPAKAEFARQHGADVGIDYTDPGWPGKVREVAPDGVDVVIDSIGGTVTAQSLELLAPFGRLVIYGASSGSLPEVSGRGLYGLRSISGFGVMPWRTARPEQARAEMTKLADLATAGRLRTAVAANVPLADAAKAHALIEDRDRLGRVLLVP